RCRVKLAEDHPIADDVLDVVREHRQRGAREIHAEPRMSQGCERLVGGRGLTQLCSNSTRARVTAPGCSRLERCPEPGTLTRREAEIPAASSDASSGGVSASDSPTRTSVGQRIAARPGRESGRVMMAVWCLTKASGPTSLAMVRTICLRLASLCRDLSTSRG